MYNFPNMPDLPNRLRRRSASEVIRKARAGDADAWSSLVDLYGPYVRAIIRSARVPEADQPDAFQYVFVELLKALPNLRNNEDLLPWVRQTTLRNAIRVRDRSTRHQSLDESMVSLDGDIQNAFVVAETHLHVREAVGELSSKCHDLIMKLFFDDPPRAYADVAAEMGLRATSMSVTRHRCLKALEASLRARGLS